MSSLKALKGYSFPNSILQIVIQKYIQATTDFQKDIVFCWVPSHVGIYGNELADFTAKAALEANLSHTLVPYTDYRGCIKQFVRKQWQEWWNLCQDVKIWEVKPLLGEWSSSYRTSRREEIILSRLRIGHSYVTHSHILRGEPPPLCEHCGEPLTIKHILIECTFFIGLRTNYYNVSCLRDLFALTDPTKIFQYLKCINMFHKI